MKKNLIKIVCVGVAGASSIVGLGYAALKNLKEKRRFEKACDMQKVVIAGYKFINDIQEMRIEYLEKELKKKSEKRKS